MAVRPLLAGALAGLVLLATACGGDDDDSSATTVAATTTTAAAALDRRARPTTSSGATERERPGAVPQRIVSLSSTATETLFAIGAGDQVVAVDDQSNYPAEAAAKMTDLSGYTPNVEADRRLRPRPRRHLRRRQARVAARGPRPRGRGSATSAKTFDEAYTQIEQLGAATGHVAEAAELVGQMQTDLAALAKDVPTSEVAARRVPRARRHRLRRRRRTRSSARSTRCSGWPTSPTPPTIRPGTRS